MRSVGIKVLKNKLSHYVRIAAAGETVLVTDRDRVVAELRPPEPGRGARLDDAALASAVREGLVSPRLTSSGSVPPRRPVAPLETILSELDADRSDR